MLYVLLSTVGLSVFHPTQDESLLKGRVQLIEVAVNSVLGLEGDLESCVYFIASGRLKVYRLTGDQSKSQVHTKTHDMNSITSL